MFDEMIRRKIACEESQYKLELLKESDEMLEELVLSQMKGEGYQFREFTEEELEEMREQAKKEKKREEYAEENQIPLFIALENKLGYTINIKTELIYDYSFTAKGKVETKKDAMGYDIKIINATDFYIIVSKENISKLEEFQPGALKFLKNVQISKVYLVHDNLKEEIVIPWSDNYMDMINKLQKVTEDENDILIEIKEQK